MNLLGILKSEYFYQPKVALNRLLPFKKQETGEFVEKMLPWGMSIRVRPLEEIGLVISTLGVIDLPVTEALWRLTEPGELVVDVGANIGSMTAVLAKRVSAVSGGCVWSFEAHPEIFEELKYNVEKWQKQLHNTNLIIKNLAVSDQVDTVKINIPQDFEHNRGLAFITTNENVQETNQEKLKVLTVESCTLDDVLLGKEIGVLKIDVEGHELKVIEGAKKLLQEGKIRDCIFEEHQEYPTPVTTYFESMGYKVLRISKNFNKPVLLDPNSKNLRTYWQPTSFLATRNLERATSIFQKRGWQTLSQKG